MIDALLYNSRRSEVEKLERLYALPPAIPPRPTRTTQLRSSQARFFGALCCTTQCQLQRLSNPFHGRTHESSIFAAKIGSRVLSREAQNWSVFGGKSKNMRARPQVRDILIAHKLRYWSLRARYSYPNCSPSRARRNFLRLLARHREIARRLNLDLRDAYPPV